MSLQSKGYLTFRPFLNAATRKPIVPATGLAKNFINISGYRKLGLRADDLVPEENEVVQLAIRRLPPKESYDRIFRIRRAVQCSIAHQLLPPQEHTKPEDDIAYLSPYIAEIEAEIEERQALDTVIVERKAN